MKNLILILIIIFKSMSLCAQLSHSDSVRIIVDSLSKEEKMTLGWGKFNSKNAIKLFSLATKDDLLNLTKHTSPIVRVYSIYYLTQSYSGLPFIELIKEHLDDLEAVRIAQYERSSEGPPDLSFPAYSVGAMFVKFIGSTLVGEYLVVESVNYKPYLKDTVDLQKVDSVLICTPNKLKETENLLIYSKAKKNYYKSVRTQVKEKQNPNAVIYLSKYQKSSDVKIILQNLPVLHSYGDYPYKFFAVFLNFQHPKMFKYLSQNLENFYQYTFYLNAVASYKNIDALNLLKRAFNQITVDKLNKERKYYVTQILLNSLNTNFVKIYSDFIFDLLESDARAYPKIPKELWKINPDRVYKYLLKHIDAPTNQCHTKNDTFNEVLKIIKNDAPAYVDSLMSIKKIILK